MHDEITHMGIVDAPLRRVAPRRVGLRIVRIDADDIERLEIGELDFFERRELAAEYEMQELPRACLCPVLCRHDSVSDCSLTPLSRKRLRGLRGSCAR